MCAECHPSHKVKSKSHSLHSSFKQIILLSNGVNINSTVLGITVFCNQYFIYMYVLRIFLWKLATVEKHFVLILQTRKMKVMEGN